MQTGRSQTGTFLMIVLHILALRVMQIVNTLKWLVLSQYKSVM